MRDAKAPGSVIVPNESKAGSWLVQICQILQSAFGLLGITKLDNPKGIFDEAEAFTQTGADRLYLPIESKTDPDLAEIMEKELSRNYKIFAEKYERLSIEYLEEGDARHAIVIGWKCHVAGSAELLVDGKNAIYSGSLESQICRTFSIGLIKALKSQDLYRKAERMMKLDCDLDICILKKCRVEPRDYF